MLRTFHIVMMQPLKWCDQRERQVECRSLTPYLEGSPRCAAL